MSASKKTTNYELPVYAPTDVTSWLTDFNGAMNKIDAQMKLNEGNATDAMSEAANAVSTANTANETANSAVSTANAASKTANSAVSTANAASKTANSAVSTANAASKTANSASTTATQAKTLAEQLRAELNALKAKVLVYETAGTGLTAQEYDKAQVGTT